MCIGYGAFAVCGDLAGFLIVKQALALLSDQQPGMRVLMVAILMFLCFSLSLRYLKLYGNVHLFVIYIHILFLIALVSLFHSLYVHSVIELVY